MSTRSISILGSTGSIGQNTLKVVTHLGDIDVVALGAGRNTALLARQIDAYRPRIAVCADESCAGELEKALFELGIKGNDVPEISFGEEGLVKVATADDAETVVSATVGAVGFVPTLRAIQAGKRVALANKETLVMAGELMTRAARDSKAEVLPVDSEHNAIHQCLRGEKPSDVKRLILTASGGPFRKKSLIEIKNATREEALDHPTWDMGDKITIDSATLMNKGLEVIEAHWLFGVDAGSIDVLVHPESVVHSMVELIDGSIIAQLGVTDMKHAIQYALTYPARFANAMPPIDFTEVSKLTFEEPDHVRFPNLDIAYRALRKGGTTPAVLNASNEIAVQAFLDGRIRLSEIAVINGGLVDSHRPVAAETLEIILQTDTDTREAAGSLISRTVSTVASRN